MMKHADDSPTPVVDEELSKPTDNQFINEEIHRRDMLEKLRDSACERVQVLKDLYDEAIREHHELVMICAGKGEKDE